MSGQRGIAVHCRHCADVTPGLIRWCARHACWQVICAECDGAVCVIEGRAPRGLAENSSKGNG